VPKTVRTFFSRVLTSCIGWPCSRGITRSRVG